MLHDPARHEALGTAPWDEAAAHAAIADIVLEAESAYDAQRWWLPHPRDVDPGEDPAAPVTFLYHGACGMFWALHYLQDVGAVRLQRDYHVHADELLKRNRACLGASADKERASLLMGDTPIRLWAYGHDPSAETGRQLQDLIAGNIDHPARELMWGSPGTLLAASFLQERSGDAVWADLFRQTAAKLWSQLEWSEEHACHCWSQDLYGQHSNYLDGVHGFVATASPLIRGRHLLADGEWARWQDVIVNTVRRTATWDDGRVNWRAWLSPPPKKPLLMQFCHGSPGFIVCLAGLPTAELDDVLLAAGEAVWQAGPLTKGSNLCHGTGGNGYALLVLHQRTGEAIWLERARAFAMHAIAQMQADRAQYGRGRHALWTGDIGLAIYLWDCLRGRAAFPTLDVFYGR